MQLRQKYFSKRPCSAKIDIKIIPKTTNNNDNKCFTENSANSQHKREHQSDDLIDIKFGSTFSGN